MDRIKVWNIIARAEGHAVLWTKEWGKGRVHTNVLGHDGRALNNLACRRRFSMASSGLPIADESIA